MKNKYISCKLCAEYSRKRGCVSKHCPHYADRVAGGSLRHKDAVAEAFQSIPIFRDELTAIKRRVSAGVWNGTEHKQRMDALRLYVGCRKSICTNEYLAAMYLMTVTEPLYSRTRLCFTQHGLDFAFADNKGLTIDEYTLLGTAKTLYLGTEDLTAKDISEPEIVSATALPFIVNAVLTVRFGEDFLYNIR